MGNSVATSFFKKNLGGFQIYLYNTWCPSFSKNLSQYACSQHINIMYEKGIFGYQL